MIVRKRCSSLPWDAWLGYAAAGYFALRLAVSVAAGPNLLLMLSGCLVYPISAAVALIICIRLVSDPPRRRRVLPLALVSGCLVAAVGVPDADVDLHLVSRVYLAGGPVAVNKWGQELIREHRGKRDSVRIEPEQLPPAIRDSLPGWVSVGGTLWSDLPQVRVELGGGFYHYGIVIYPTDAAPPAEWWQRVLGWPPELVVYHEN
jgi:hypothetical protein